MNQVIHISGDVPTHDIALLASQMEPNNGQDEPKQVRSCGEGHREIVQVPHSSRERIIDEQHELCDLPEGSKRTKEVDEATKHLRIDIICSSIQQ